MVIKNSAQHYEPEHTRGLSYVEEVTLVKILNGAGWGGSVAAAATFFLTSNAWFNKNYSIIKRGRAMGRWVSLAAIFGGVIGGAIGMYRAWYMPLLPGLEKGSKTYRAGWKGDIPLKDQLWLSYGNEIRTNNVINRRGVVSIWRNKENELSLKHTEENWSMEKEGVVRGIKSMLQDQGTGDLFDPDRQPRIRKPPSFRDISDVEPFSASDSTVLSQPPDHMKSHQCTECGKNFFSPFERDYHRLAEHGQQNEWQQWVGERETDADYKQMLWNMNLSRPDQWPTHMQDVVENQFSRGQHPALSTYKYHRQQEDEFQDAHYNPVADEIYHRGDSRDQQMVQAAQEYARGNRVFNPTQRL